MKRAALMAGVFLLIASLAGCSDEPNATGIGLLPPEDSLKVDSLQVSPASSFTYRLPISGSSPTLLLGIYQNIESRVLLQFTGIPASQSGITIDSATLKLAINYRFKDSAGTLGFEVREMLREWSETSFRWDSLTPGTVSDTVDATYLRAITPRDSVLTLRIDDLVRKWSARGIVAPAGIILVPSTISATNIVIGIYSPLDPITGSYILPELTISYHDTSDTASVVLRPSKHEFVANCDLHDTDDRMFVQAGVAYRGLLKFDVGSIPSNASITSARMEVVLDTTASLLNAYSNRSLVAHLVLNGAAPPTLSGIASSGTPVADSAGVYRFDIRNIVQLWVTGSQNYGVALRAAAEFSSLDRFMVRGAGAPAGLKPRLSITYTLLP